MGRFRTNRRGFTLVELIVVLAIGALLAGLTIPSAIPWYQNQKALERAANAQTIYTTAQHNIVSLRSQGALDDYEGGYLTASKASTDNKDLGRATLASCIARAGAAVAPAKDPAGEVGSENWDADLVVLDSAQADGSAQAALSELVPHPDTLIAHSTFAGPFAGPGRYFVILNPRTGYVYGVFYSEDASLSYDDVYAHQDDADWLGAHQVAFYGGVTQLPIKADEQAMRTYVGYFELDAAHNVTGLYGYEVDETGAVNGTVSSFLWDNNDISTACYGILTSDTGLEAKLNEADLDLGNPIDVVPLDGQEGLPGSMKLYVYSGNSDTWIPDNAWTDASDKTASFNVKQDFAAEISLNADGGSASFGTTHQVRTADQLQHISKPTSTADAAAYLGADQTFFQTHDIVIASDWQSIGLVNVNGSVNAPFKGTYEGAFADAGDRTQSDLSNADGTSYGCSTPVTERLVALEAGASNATFQPRVYLASGANFQAGLAGAQIPDWAPATGAGVFGSVEGGTISHATLSAQGSVDLETLTASVASGLLVGKASNATIDDCAIDLRSQQTASWRTESAERAITLDATRGWGASTWNDGVLSVGGLVGHADATVFVGNRVTLATSNSSLASSLTLSVQDTGRNLAVKAGGLAGYAHKATFDRANDAVNTVSVVGADGDSAAASLSVSAKTGTSASAGGFCGSLEASSIDDSTPSNTGDARTSALTSTDATVNVTATNARTTYAGGFAGSVTASSTVANAFQTNGSVAAGDGPSFTVNAKGPSWGTSWAGGLIGYLNGSAIKDAAPAFSAQMSVTASDQTVYAGGIVGQAESSTITDLNPTLDGNSVAVHAQGADDGGNAWAGGLAGSLANKSALKGADATLKAHTASTAATAQNAYAGGAIGTADSSSVSSLNPTVSSDSFAVSAQSADGDGKALTGGLIGSLSNASTLDGSNATFKAQTASVTANAIANAYAGGLAGQADSSSLSSSNPVFGRGSFTVSAQGDAGWGSSYAGGTIGQATSSSVASLTQTVDGTSGDAALSIDATANSSRAGGFAGDVTGANKGIGLAFDTLALASGSHSANLEVGSGNTRHTAGFVGWLSNTEMANCALSSDNVTTGASKVTLNQRTYSPASGMVAVGERSSIKRSFVEANIASQTASGIGFFFGSDQSDRGTTISDCAAIGIVSGAKAYGFTVDQAKDQSRGGILAYAPSKISNSYAAVKVGSDATDAQLAAFCEMDAGRVPPDNLSNCVTAGTKNTDLGSIWTRSTGRLSSFTYRSATNGTLATELGSAFHDTVTTSSRGPFPVATTTAKGTAVSPADYISSWQDDERASELQEQVLDQMLTIANAHKDAARIRDRTGRSVLRSSDFLPNSSAVGSLNWMKDQLRAAGTNASDPDALKIIDSLTAYQVEFGPRGAFARYGGVWAQLAGTTYQLTDFEDDGNGNLDGVWTTA